MSKRHVVTIALLLTGILITGCIKRKERIKVEASGRVEMTVHHETDSFAELYNGDAVPSLDRGWIVVEDVSVDEDGTEIFTLEATAAFPPDVDLPRNYTAVRDRFPEASLQFPTHVVIEDRPDGTYYHFRRVYEPRPWATVDGPRQALQQRVEEIVAERDFDDLEHGERVAVFRIVLEIESLKLTSFARRAFVEVSPEAPQDLWLRLDAALEGTISEIDIASLVALMTNPDVEDKGERLEEEEAALRERTRGVAERLLLESGVYTRSRVNEFMDRLEYHTRYHEITEELQDDEFEIVVELPGEIVGHNGLEQAGPTVTWRFDGTHVRDREIELMATSRVRR